jgi:signal transduction histidine kinase
VGAQVDRSMALLDSLLALARAESAPLTLGRVSMRQAAQEVVDALSLEHGAALPVRVDPALPDVHGDAALLRQVYANLIGNALKFSTEATAPRVEVGAEPPHTFFVRDNGVGFDATDHAEVFRPFVRRHPRVAGFGIGLSIVQRVIHRHGGEVWAESRPGRGATFYFRLPVTP